MNKNKVSKQTIELYLGKGLSLYDTLHKINDELSRINYVLKNQGLFKKIEDYKDYKKYATERKSTLKGMVLLINKELGYKNKTSRDKILDKHLSKLKKIRGMIKLRLTSGVWK